jgi:hypothetical protein
MYDQFFIQEMQLASKYEKLNSPEATELCF